MDREEREARLDDLRDASAKQAVERLAREQAEASRKMEEAQQDDFNERLAARLQAEKKKEPIGPVYGPEGSLGQQNTPDNIERDLRTEDRKSVESKVMQPYDSAMDRVIEIATNNPSHGMTADGLIFEATKADPVREGISPTRSFENIQTQQEKREAMRKQLGVMYQRFGRELEGRGDV